MKASDIYSIGDKFVFVPNDDIIEGSNGWHERAIFVQEKNGGYLVIISFDISEMFLHDLKKEELDQFQEHHDFVIADIGYKALFLLDWIKPLEEEK
jgi:hypothetical protein